MKSLNIALLTCGLLLSAGSLPAAEPADEWNLLPQPQTIHVGKGRGLRPSDLRYIVAGQSPMPVLYGHLDRLPRAEQPGPGVTLELDSTDTPESEEGYRLELTDRGVAIRSRGEAGLFYGCLTLGQLLAESEESGRPIPPMRIVDYPAIAFRAVHFDTKHHLDRMEYYYRVIDRLAQWKVNAVIWEIEDKLRYERRPECAAPNAMSKQEMQALCRYARERHVEINPLVQGLGHAGFILKHHWELRENPASDWEFCPSDPRTYEVQFDLYRDALEAMPDGKYLHIGGDEITEIGIDARCRATGKTPFELQMGWLKKVCDFAKANGRTPIFWDDMPLKYADLWWVLHGGLSDEEVEKNWTTEKLNEAIGLFPSDCIYMRWHYDDPTILPHLKILDWYRTKGLRVMGATAASDGGSPFMPRYDSKAHDIRNFCRLVGQNGLEGIFATSWDDGSPHWETVMRGFAALGEFGWNPSGRQVDTFKKVHACREFGLDAAGTRFIDELERSAFFFDGALVTEGRRNPAWQVQEYALLDLPDRNAPGRWSAAHAALLDSARIETVRHAGIAKALRAAKGLARRNRYTLDVYEQNNELFHYPAKLLLALEAFDKAATEAARQEAERNIRELCGAFRPLRDALEAVYSRTRFMRYPDGYVADMNHHHHLAALTPDSGWIYLYESAYLDRVSEWLDE